MKILAYCMFLFNKWIDPEFNSDYYLETKTKFFDNLDAFILSFIFFTIMTCVVSNGKDLLSIFGYGIIVSMFVIKGVVLLNKNLNKTRNDVSLLDEVLIICATIWVTTTIILVGETNYHFGYFFLVSFLYLYVNIFNKYVLEKIDSYDSVIVYLCNFFKKNQIINL